MKKFGLSLVGMSLVAPSVATFAGNLSESDLMKMGNRDIVNRFVECTERFFDSVIGLVEEGDKFSDLSKQKVVDAFDDLVSILDFMCKWELQFGDNDKKLGKRLFEEFFERFENMPVPDDNSICKETKDFLVGVFENFEERISKLESGSLN